MRNSSRTRPGGAQQHVGADDRERQQHELDPARDHDRRHAGRRRGRGSPAARRRPARPRRRPRAGSPLRRRCAAPSRRLCLRAAITSILFIGDVVGRAGRRALRELLPGLRDELATDFVVVNGENAAGGIGITPKEADELLRARRRRDHARQPHLPPPRDLALPRRASARIVRPATTCRRSRAAGRRGRARRRLARRSSTCPAIVFLQAGAPALVAIDEALREVARRRPRSSSTCTPRRRARRSRSAGISTAR